MPASVQEQDHPLDGLADCVRRLDPGTRALLDLSVRRRMRDDDMAPLLRIDAFHLAWRRARALERVASDLGGTEPLPLAQVRAALESLPRDVWDPLSRPALEPPREEEPTAPAEPERDLLAEAEEEVVTEETDALVVEPAAASETTALVPLPSADLAEPRARLTDRLDAFAASAPTLRRAFGDVGRAFGRKAVRMVVWRRRAAAS
jgi:hypothetical protein